MNSIRVLIADDQSFSREALKKALIDKGLNVVGEAINGREAVEQNERLRPDIIIMDVKMLELDGIETTGEINLKSPVPIILLTAKDEPGPVELVKNTGVMGYMVKPFNKKELIPNIEIAISRFNEFKTLRKENADLKETLEARKQIERAKGILMKKDKIEENEAFKKIQKLSMDKNIPMKEVARSVILTAEL